MKKAAALKKLIVLFVGVMLLFGTLLSTPCFASGNVFSPYGTNAINSSNLQETYVIKYNMKTKYGIPYGSTEKYKKYIMQEQSSGKIAYELFEVFSTTKTEMDKATKSFGFLSKLILMINGKWKDAVAEKTLSNMEEGYKKHIKGYYVSTLTSIEAEGWYDKAIKCLIDLI